MVRPMTFDPREYVARLADGADLELLPDRFILNQDARVFVLRDPTKPGLMATVAYSGLEEVQNSDDGMRNLLDCRFAVARNTIENGSTHPWSR